jgi:hypothetical protein
VIYKVGSRGEAVKQIQNKLGIKVDGYFGPQTRKYVILFQQTHKLSADGIIGALTWQALFGTAIPTPVTPAVFYQSELMNLFGDPHESSFRYQWIVPATVHRWKFECHKLMVGPLQKAVENLNAAGLIQEWHTYDGCWVVRYMRGSSQLSIHSWGLAIDINAAENPFNSPNFAMTEAFAKCWKDAGFIWGGDWSSPVDAMHMQIPRIG